MKTLLILILGGLLCGGAFLSRPSEEDFKKMIRANMASERKDGLLERIFNGGKNPADAFLAGCKFNDRVLWTDVERDGKKIYTGAFSRWFETESKPAAATTTRK